MSLDTAPARHYAAVTKSDSTDLGAVRGLYIGGTGDLAVRFRGGTATVTFESIPAGTLLPICCQYVMAATTATKIIALY